MGAIFVTVLEGPSAAAAFAQAVQDARHGHGHGGFTGTVAEKEGFETFALDLGGTTPETFAERVVAQSCHGEPQDAEVNAVMGADRDRIMALIEDEEAPAVHVPLGDGRHLFFGVARE